MITGPAPYYQDELVRLYLGDCLDILPELSDNSVDAVVTDPPYGLEFMGKEWDKFDTRTHYRDEREGIGYPKTKAPRWSPRDSKRLGAAQDASRNFGEWCEQWAAECLRILRPGGYLLAFGGTRTSHRLACAIEEAGFEIRDSIAWLYGSGFPKSLDVSKAIDKAAGAERESLGIYAHRPETTRGMWGAADPDSENYDGSTFGTGERHLTAPATAEAEQWQGWGTALKPAHEPIIVARKPLIGTVAANVLRWGTGALNIDACRIEGDGTPRRINTNPGIRGGQYAAGAYESNSHITKASNDTPCRIHGITRCTICPAPGRWPANVVLDESQAAALDQMSGESVSAGGSRGAGGQHGMYEPIGAQPDFTPGFGDVGGASRFYFTAKASSDERITHNGTAHPTVKPLSLMRWLVRLVTPPGGVILEPFAGSGTTVEAALLEGFRCTAIEREADYLPLITQRINRRRDPIAYLTAAGENLGLFGGVA